MEETLRLLVDGIVGSFVLHARGSEKGEKSKNDEEKTNDKDIEK